MWNWSDLGEVENASVAARINEMKILGISPKDYMISSMSSANAYSFGKGQSTQDLFGRYLADYPGILEVKTQIESVKDESGDHRFYYHNPALSENMVSITSEHKVPKCLFRKTKGVGLVVTIAHRDSGNVLQLPSGNSYTTRCIRVGEYDFIALCCHEYFGEAKWIYCMMTDVPKFRKQPRGMNEEDRCYLMENLYQSSVTINLPICPPWTENLQEILDRCVIRNFPAQQDLQLQFQF